MTTPPNLLDIIKARCLLGEYLQQTPIYRSNQFSELLDLELSIKYENFFDIAFTSPPYFNVERYSYDDTQSW